MSPAAEALLDGAEGGGERSIGAGRKAGSGGR
jgi:hypothetical protein